MFSPKRVVFPLLLSVLIGAAALSGCSGLFSDEPPLPDSTFTRVLVDLHLTTARGKRFSKTPEGIRDSLFLHHGIQHEDFDATLQYYTNNPQEFKSLYDAVIDTLNSLQNRYPTGSSSSPPDTDDRRPKDPRDDLP